MQVDDSCGAVHATPSVMDPRDPGTSERGGTLRTVWLGACLWGVLFTVKSALYPWSVTNQGLFASFLAVVLAVVATVVATTYLRDLRSRIFWRAFSAAVTWTFTCIALDVTMLMTMPPRLSVREYLEQVALIYVMIPVIAMGLAYQRVRAAATVATASRHGSLARHLG